MSPNFYTGWHDIRSLPEVMPEDAEGSIAELYEDLRGCLRVPFVNFIFRTLANFPEYLTPRWKELRPTVRTTTFDAAAASLMADLQLDGMSGRPSTISADHDHDGFRAFTATIAGIVPKLQLIATALELGLTSGEVQGEEGLYGVSDSAHQIPMADEDELSEDTGKLLEEVRARHRHPKPATYFRSLAKDQWMLRAAWEILDPVVETESYQARREAIIRASERAARELFTGPVQEPLDDGRTRDISNVFRSRVIPDLMIDVTLIGSDLGLRPNGC